MTLYWAKAVNLCVTYCFERYLFINVSEGTSGSEILVRDLTQPNSKFITLFKGFDNNYNVVDNIGDRILALTDFSAPRYRLVLVDPLNADAKISFEN